MVSYPHPFIQSESHPYRAESSPSPTRTSHTRYLVFLHTAYRHHILKFNPLSVLDPIILTLFLLYCTEHLDANSPRLTSWCASLPHKTIARHLLICFWKCEHAYKSSEGHIRSRTKIHHFRYGWSKMVHSYPSASAASI